MLLIAGPLSKYTSEYADQGSTEYQYFSKIFLYKVRYPYEMMLPFKGYLSHHYLSHVKFWYWYWYFQCFVQNTLFTSNLHTVFGLVLKLHFHLIINGIPTLCLDVVLLSTSPRKEIHFLQLCWWMRELYFTL